MDVEELSMIGPVVDLGSVNAIHRKRLLAFLNHFIIQSASFLNKVSQTCEAKLVNVDLRLQKLEAALILLESKLSSIPGLDVVTERVAPPPSVTIPSCDSEVNMETVISDNLEENDNNDVVERESIDPSLQVYVNMLRVGVPMPAVKFKMSVAGVPSETQDHILAAAGK